MVNTLEFEGSVEDNGQINVPDQIAQQIPRGEQLQIFVTWRTPSNADDWKELGRQRFEAAYAPEDSIYDQLDK